MQNHLFPILFPFLATNERLRRCNGSVDLRESRITEVLAIRNRERLPFWDQEVACSNYVAPTFFARKT